MVFNNQVLACLFFNVFAFQTSRDIGLYKPKPRGRFSGYSYSSSCSLILNMYWLSIVRIACLCKHSSKFHTCTLYKPNQMIATYITRHFCDTSFRYIVKFARIKTYLQLQRNTGKIMLRNNNYLGNTFERKQAKRCECLLRDVTRHWNTNEKKSDEKTTLFHDGICHDCGIAWCFWKNASWDIIRSSSVRTLKGAESNIFTCKPRSLQLFLDPGVN